MGAYRTYNDEIIEHDVILYFVFECKVCNETWVSSFCICPRCKKINKYRLLSNEQARQLMMENEIFHQMSVYGLLLGEKQ